MLRRKEKTYIPGPVVLAAWPEGASGNTLNGQGETVFRPASPMFWHPAEQHPFGHLQQIASDGCRVTPEAIEEFGKAREYPALVPINPERAERTAQQWTTLAQAFALENESDLFGTTTVKPHYVVQGYSIDVPNVIALGFAHDYDNLKQAPSSPENGKAIAEVGRQYARCTRASYKLANWIRQQGFFAYPYPGPRADALLLIPAAIDAGLGELGKHGSLINRTYGANLRLAGVATDMPLVHDEEDVFGSDDFCLNCRICDDACPPGAITDQKQWVRGAERWYVDFDKCIPYFAENAGCAICLAVCPWSRPGVAENLLVKMARRREAQARSRVIAALTAPEMEPAP